MSRNRHRLEDDCNGLAVANSAFMRPGSAFLWTSDLGVYVSPSEAVDFARALLVAAGVTDYAVQPTTAPEGS